MPKIEIEYKYKVGQVVYFMYNDEIRRGIVANIDITISSKKLETYLTKKIIDKVISIFDKDYPMQTPNIRYTLDLVSKKGDYESTPHLKYEHQIFETKEDILKEMAHV